MPNLLTIVRERQEGERGRRSQQMIHGTVIAIEGGQYKVVAGAFTFLCQTGISDALKAGDRVWIIAGRGSSQIVGLMGKDENAA